MSFSSDNLQIKENNKTLKKNGLLEIDFDKFVKSLHTLIICPFIQIQNNNFNEFPQSKNLDSAKFSFKNRKNYLDYLGVDRKAQFEFMNKYSNMEEGMQFLFEYWIENFNGNENENEEILFGAFLAKNYGQSSIIDEYIKNSFKFVSGQIFGV